MNTKEVIDRERSGKLVLQAGETHGGNVAEALLKRLKKHARQGEEQPDIRVMITLCGRRLGASLDAMLAADEAHERELGDDNAPRAARDAAQQTLYKLVVEMRDQVQSVLKDAGLEKLGMKDPSPPTPDRLAAYARSVISKLGDPKITLPTPTRRTATIDREAMREEIAEALEPLTVALQDVTRETKEAEVTLVARQKSIAEYDAVFAETAALYEALFRAAGMNEIADRVRPSKRNPGRTLANNEGDAPDGPAAPAKPA